jgi:hypothetical protein
VNARQLLEATERTLLWLTRDLPEQGRVNEWTGVLRDLWNEPVQEYDWEAWHARVVKADEPDVPGELVAAFAETGAVIAGELWPEAGAVRAAAESLPFDADDLDEALAGTMEQVRGISESHRQALQRMMALAIEEQEGQFAFARRIRQEWDEFAGRRAEVVAVTEWNRAASTATLLGYRATGVERKVWFAVKDACQVCEANAAQGAIPINELFSGDFDAPPAHPGCRCNVSAA